VRTKHTASTLLIVLLLSYTATALMGMFLLGTVKAQPTVTMWVTPPTRISELGSTFNISIWLNDTEDEFGPYDVKSWTLAISFDPRLIEYADATEGSYLKKNGGSTVLFKPSPGAPPPVSLVSTITAGGTVEGPGDLVSVTFRVIDNGRTVIDLKDTELRDSVGAAILASSVDGSFYTTYPRAKFFSLPSTIAQPVSGIEFPDRLKRDPFVNETVTFNATAYLVEGNFRGSYDPETATEGNPTGEITNYLWDFDDGTVISGNYPAVTHSFNTTIQYLVNLTVTDNEGKSSWYAPPVQPIIRDVGISSIEITPPVVSPGEDVSIKVNITNYGTFKGTELVNVTLFYTYGGADVLIPYNVSLGLKHWCNVHVIDPDSKSKPMQFSIDRPRITLNYTWQTTGLASGNYTVWANISQVSMDASQFLRDAFLREMDLNLANNNMTWGKLRLLELPNVAITKISLAPTLKSPNVIDYGIDQVTITVKVENTGDFDETFNVTLHQDSTLLIEWTGVFLEAKTPTTLEYVWATSALSRGYYNLIAQASNVTGEVENDRTGDNKLILNVIITSAPVATFTYSPVKPLVGDSINVDASASYAAPGWSISTYTWIVNGTVDKTLNKAAGRLSTILQNRAVWNVTLRVTDNATVSSSLSKLIRVGSLPVAQFTFAPAAPKADQAIAFDASLSTPDTPPIEGDEIKTYNWDFGDGTKVVYTGTNFTKTTTHSYAKSGNFSVTLKVFDGDDFNATITKFVEVAKITSGVTINLNAQTIEVGQSVTISGQVTPTRAGAKVSILYKTDTTDWTLLQDVTSDQAGHYQHIWTIDTVGNYTVKARFAADDKYTPSESQTATLQVQSTPPQPPPSPPDWTVYIIVGAMAVVIVIAVAVYLMRRK